MGVGKHANIVHLIDFGLSKEFRDPNTHMHIPLKEGLGLTGTATFASINSHLGLELGRRDDLESLAYILFYFQWGFLPWQGLGQDVLESKRTLRKLDIFRGLPLEFRTFFDHCCSLSFRGKPNYDFFCSQFNDLLVREGLQRDVAFDWDVAQPQTPVTGGKIPGQYPSHGNGNPLRECSGERSPSRSSLFAHLL
jgi:serine/threonine protein kinase